MTEHKIDGKIVEPCNLIEGQLCMYQGCWEGDSQIYCMITSFTPKCRGRIPPDYIGSAADIISRQ